MTRADLYTFVTSLLNDTQIDETLFENLLDNAQMEVEGMRPWVQLRSSDATQSWNPGDTYQTGKTLNASFREWYEEQPVILLDTNKTPFQLSEIPYSQNYLYKDQVGRFAVDYPNNLLYIMGTPDKAYTVVQNFIKVSTLVSATSTSTWIFPARFHKILGLMVAEKWKNGIDYDVFSNAQANQQTAQATDILNEMTRWDSRLQQSMTRGLNPFSGELGFENRADGTHIV